MEAAWKHYASQLEGYLHLSRKAARDYSEQTDDPLPLVFRESPAQIVTKKYTVRLVVSFSEPTRRREKKREREGAALCGERSVVLTPTTNS